MKANHISNTDTPQDAELEKVLIGALLNDAAAITEVVTILTPETLYDPINGAIYGIMRRMYDAGKQIDLYTVAQECRSSDEFTEVKILPYLARCTQKVGSGAHATSHAMIIKQHYIAREISVSALRLSAMANDPAQDIEQVISQFSQQADYINELAAGGTMSQHIDKSLSEAMKTARKRQVLRQRGEVSGITTGLTELDRMTGGWQGSQLIIVAARPAMGKTALMLHMAKSAAQQGVSVCIYSLEMSDVSLANRLLLSECSVDVDNFRAGRLSTEDWQQLEQARAQLSRLPIYVDDRASVSMRYIKSHSSIMAKRGKCGLIMCDYLQLADTSTADKNRNREQEVAQASRQAKIIAKELNVPFILLSQLSRKVEDRKDNKPMLSDLRESGAIEQDADIVSFIYRPAYYGISTQPTNDYGVVPTQGLGMLFVEKQRDGATGCVPFRHNPSMTKITDYNTLQTEKTPF